MSRKQHASIAWKSVGCNNVIYFSRIHDVSRKIIRRWRGGKLSPLFRVSRLALCLSLPAPFVSTFRNGTGISGMTLETARASAPLIAAQRGVYFSRGVNCESTAPRACPPVLRVSRACVRARVCRGTRFSKAVDDVGIWWP